MLKLLIIYLPQSISTQFQFCFMKKALLTTIILLNFLITFAQITIEEGPELKGGYNVPRKVLGKNDKYFFVLRTELSEKKHTIEKYSIDNLSLISVTDISLGNKGKQMLVLKDAFYLNGKIYIFRTSTNHKDGKLILFIQTISEDGVIDENLLEVFTVNIKQLNSFVQYHWIWEYNYENYAQFSIVLSNDNKNILVISEEIKQENNSVTLTKVSSKILDAATLNVEQEKEIPWQYKSTKIFPFNYKIDNSKNIHFIYNYLTPENRFQCAVGSITPNSSSILGTDINLDLTKYKIESINYIINNNTIYCGGVYKSNKDKDKEAKDNQMGLFGVFSQKINISEFKTEQFEAIPFSGNLIKNLTMDTPELCNNFKVDDLKIIENDIYTIAQVYFPYSALIIFKTSGNGKIEWITNVNNKYSPESYFRMSTYLDISSCYYHALTSNNGLSIIFNENPRNFKKNDAAELHSKELKNYNGYGGLKGTSVICAQISKDGNIERRELFKNKKYCLLFLPKVLQKSFITPFPMNNNIVFSLDPKVSLIYLKNDKGRYMQANRGKDKFGKLRFN